MIMSLVVKGIDHLVLNVANVEASAAWYAKVLGMQIVHDHGRTALLFGTQKITLRPASMSKEAWFTADHPIAGSDDLCFLTDSSPQAVRDHLYACDVPIEVGPIARDGARGPMTSLYCRDPDGDLIEIASYDDRL